MALSSIHLIRDYYQGDLDRLGLTVDVAERRFLSSGLMGLNVSLSFRRRDETFSPELVDFLRTRVEYSDAQIRQLMEESTYTAS